MLVFFFPFFENLGTYVSDSMRAHGFVFERHQRSDFLDFLLEKLYGMRARALGVLGGSAAKDKCRVADKKQTNKPTDKPTNKHTLLFYRYRYLILCHSTGSIGTDTTWYR